MKPINLAAGLAVGAAAVFTLAAEAPAQTVVGVTSDSIKIGHTNPYSGPASAYGAIGRGISAYVDSLNARGGVNGRFVEFVTLDDGYSPPKTVEQIRKLVERERVAFLFQNLGTPTNSAVHEYVNARRVPHLFVATGATKWGDPQNYPWTMGWQPNYQTEGAIYANFLKENRPDAKVAILFQNDDYGKDYVKGFRDALGDLADTVIVAEESYETSDPTVDSQVVNLAASEADVFFNVAIPKFAAQAIVKAYDTGWRPYQLLNSVSNSVATVLRPAGNDKSDGVVSAFYIKDPTDPRWRADPEFREWARWMRTYYPGGDLADSFNAYAYAVGQTLEQVLTQAGDNLSRENIRDQAANLRQFRAKMLLPGVTISTSPTDYYPIESMQLWQFSGDAETWDPIGPIVSAESS